MFDKQQKFLSEYQPIHDMVNKNTAYENYPKEKIYTLNDEAVDHELENMKNSENLDTKDPMTQLLINQILNPEDKLPVLTRNNF
mmetsp:Transcript_23986/g.21313  ORF Transcript_23986/g.21313 Transcript_23986/m.21313 type:complete len:84 (-) Transcript_23986:111-362(-)